MGVPFRSGCGGVKPGDLVQPVVPKNHGSPRIRIYDVPHVIIEERVFPEVVGKMEEGTTGLVLELDGGRVKVLYRGVVGWVKEELLRVVE